MRKKFSIFTGNHDNNLGRQTMHASSLRVHMRAHKPLEYLFTFIFYVLTNGLWTHCCYRYTVGWNNVRMEGQMDGWMGGHTVLY